FHRWLVAHHRDDTDRSKSGKSKGACTGLGQINAAAFNIRPSVRDRDRDGMTILLVGHLDFGTKGQRFVRRRHGGIVERNAAGSFGSRLRRVTHGVHRCDTVFSTNWNVEQTKYERGDQPSHAWSQIYFARRAHGEQKFAELQRSAAARRRLADQT